MFKRYLVHYHTKGQLWGFGGHSNSKFGNTEIIAENIDDIKTIMRNDNKTVDKIKLIEYLTKQ